MIKIVQRMRHWQQLLTQFFSWGDDRRSNTPMHKSVIYEMHVRGFTKLNEAIPEELRGTYAGLASAPAINYLKSLGCNGSRVIAGALSR